MNSSSDTEQLDEVMSECDSNDCINKDIIVSVVPENVWSEIQLADRERCYKMFRMRRSVFHLLHETF
jgi:hypothetical protein